MDIVLNWIWQGAVVAATTAVVLATISPARAATRYVVAWAGLVSVLALPLALTFSIADPAAGASIGGVVPADTSSALPYLSIPARWLISGAAISAAWLGWVTWNGISLMVAMLALAARSGSATRCPQKSRNNCLTGSISGRRDGGRRL